MTPARGHAWPRSRSASRCGALAVPADAGRPRVPVVADDPAVGTLPEGGEPIVTLNSAIGEREGAWIVVTGAQDVSATIDAARSAR